VQEIQAGGSIPDGYIGAGSINGRQFIVPISGYNQFQDAYTASHRQSDSPFAALQDMSEGLAVGLGGPLAGYGITSLAAGTPFAAGGASAAQGAANSAGGSGMWDWLDSFDPTNFEGGSSDFFNPDYSQPFSLNTSDPFAVNPNDPFGPSQIDLGRDPLNTITAPPTGNPLIDNPGMVRNLAGSGFVPAASNSFFGGITGADVLKNAPSLFSGLKGLFAPSGTGSPAPSTGSGVLGSILNDPLGAAFNATPFLLALNEANRQSGDLNNVLNQINGDAYTRTVLNPYDMETGAGRTSLLNDQELRGVRGSSFGDQALNNYDYMRAIGRGDLANRGILSSAQLQGSLINQRNTNRNLLLGAGLNASGRLFSPQPDPFGLRALGLIQ
jgi:hypothetical protein